MTEDVIVQAAKRPNEEPFLLLFRHYKSQIQVTSKILKSACRHNLKDTVDLLLKIKSENLQISHDMIAAAAENVYDGKDILELLQQTLASQIRPLPITADVVEAAVKNLSQGEQVLRLLIQSNKQQTRLSVSETAMLSAAYSGHMKVLELFQMELGYNISDELLSIAALRNACKVGDSDSVRDLIRKGIYPDHPGYKGRTPLFEAAASNNTEIVDMLLQTKLVDVNRQDADGWSPILYAVQHQNHEMIRSLVQAKAKVDISNKRGTTAEYFARSLGFCGMFRYLTTTYG
ncbi:ankyrin repeat-containing domain protein [Aspergillus floccosus]